MKDHGKAFRRDGKVSLLPGGARDLGAEIAAAMVQADASVLVTDLLAKEGRALVDAIRSDGGLAAARYPGSDASRRVTGVQFVIDGGYTAH